MRKTIMSMSARVWHSWRSESNDKWPILLRGRRRTIFIHIETEEPVNRYPQNCRMLACWYVDIYNLKQNTKHKQASKQIALTLMAHHNKSMPPLTI
jgi:hypothetical protein